MSTFGAKIKRNFNKVIYKLINGLAQAENGISAEPKPAYGNMPELIRHIAADGAVMLKNDGVLPLAEGTEIALFGRVQYDYFCVGYGSGGDVRAPYKKNLVDGIKENGKLNLNEELASIYASWRKKNPVDHGFWAHWPRYYPEMPLSAEIAKRAAESSTAAVVVIGRSAGEDRENTLERGSYYLTETEQKMLDVVTSAFNKTIVLLDIGSIIDMSWILHYGDKISSVVIVWQGGMESGRAVADILSGDAEPSGRLPMTIARDYNDYPSANCFGAKEFNEYKEDIFVGYRYFQTFKKDKVLFPFGFGLGYTSFVVENTEVNFNNGTLTVTAIIHNTGARAGRFTAELYVGAPQGKLGKPERVLVGFKKTALLTSGGVEEIKITVAQSTFASYDDSGVTGNKSCYVLEAGEYNVYFGSDSASADKIYAFDLAELLVVEHLTEVSAPKYAFDRMTAETKNGQTVLTYKNTPTVTTSLKDIIINNLPESVPYTGDKGYKLADVKSGKVTMSDFVAQLSLVELEAISRGDYTMNSKLGAAGNAGAIGGVLSTLREKGVSAVITTDGPSGIRLKAVCSLLPIGTLLASTWDPEEVSALYSELGGEMLERGSDVLLAPGMNIHRNPLCGRNFEYYSEDPLLTGKTAAALVRGLQSRGVSACPKHFACNNQETRRNYNDSRLSERALREIYLKGFEICVKEGKPHNIMTSYNKINGVWGHYNYELVTTVLRGEWGYKGCVMTDWWMRSSNSPEFPELNDNAYRVRAQVDVLMPGGSRVGRKKPDGTLLKTYGKPNGITLGEMQRTAQNVLNMVLNSSAYNRIDKK